MSEETKIYAGAIVIGPQMSVLWLRTSALRWRQPPTAARDPVLQQAWQSQSDGAIEWRDIEVVLSPPPPLPEGGEERKT